MYELFVGNVWLRR